MWTFSMRRRSSSLPAVHRDRQRQMQRRMSDKRKQQRGDDDSGRLNYRYEDVESTTPEPTKGTILMTSFYIGVVLICLGLLITLSSMMPVNIVNVARLSLGAVGVTLILLGLILLINYCCRLLSIEQDKKLNREVSSKLGETRPGHVLCRNRDDLIDITTLAPPCTSSRSCSGRNRAGSSRSINRSTMYPTKTNQNTVKDMLRSTSARRSMEQTSLRQYSSTTTAPVIPSNISRNNSQRVSRYNQESKNSLSRSSTEQEFPARTSSLKNKKFSKKVRVANDSKNLFNKSIKEHNNKSINQKTANLMVRSSSVRRSIEKASPIQCISKPNGPIQYFNISRYDSHGISRCNLQSRSKSFPY